MKAVKFFIYLLIIPTLFFFIQSGMISYMLISGSVKPEGQIFYGAAPSYFGSILSTITSFIVLAVLVYSNNKLEKPNQNAES